MVTHGKLLAHYGNVVWLNANMRTDVSTKRKHPTQALNTSTKPKHTTQALMGATRLASGKVQLLFSGACVFSFYFSDARRVAPIRV